MEQHGPGQCAANWTMVNKPYQGKHDAGYDLCVRVSGKVCNAGQPGGTATLKDMSHDGQRVPAAPHVDGKNRCMWWSPLSYRCCCCGGGAGAGAGAGADFNSGQIELCVAVT